MGLISFFKVPRYNKFTYMPRYYDPRAEEREKRIRQIKREMGIKEEGEQPYVPNIKGHMGTYFKKQRLEKRYSNLRLAVIIIILFIISYYLFFA